MSATELGEMMGTLQEIDILLFNISKHAGTLKTEVGHAAGELREVEYIFYRLTSALRRAGLPPEMDKALAMLQKLIVTIRMLHSSMILLQAGTPTGWILGLVSVGMAAGMALTMPEMMYDATLGR